MAGDLYIRSIEYVDGQEPNDDDDDFATTVTADIQVTGALLASLLGVQRRVLRARLEKATSKQVVNAITSGRTKAAKQILSALKPQVKAFVRNDLADELGRDAGSFDIDWDDNTDYAEVQFGEESVRVTLDLEALGAFLD